MSRFTIALTALAALAVSAIGQDKAYDLKLRKELPGDRYQIVNTDLGDTRFRLELMGQEMAKTEKKAVKQSYIEEIVTKPAGAKKATKLTRRYTVAETTKDGKRTVHSYQGQTVTIEKKDGKYTFKVDGQELAGEEAEDLDQEFNKKDDVPLENDDFMPGKPVKIGDSWAIDAKKVAESFEAGLPFVLDAGKTTVRGKLTKVYDKAGKPYGTIALDLNLVVKELKVDGQEIALKAGSTIKVLTTLDVVIDGSSHVGTEESKMTIDLNGEIPNGTISIKGDVKMTKVVTEAK